MGSSRHSQPDRDVACATRGTARSWEDSALQVTLQGSHGAAHTDCQSVDMWVGLLPEPLQVPRVRARHTFSVKGPMVNVPQCQARWSWSQPSPQAVGGRLRNRCVWLDLAVGCSLQAGLAALGVRREPQCVGVAAKPLGVQPPAVAVTE